MYFVIAGSATKIIPLQLWHLFCRISTYLSSEKNICSLQLKNTNFNVMKTYSNSEFQILLTKIFSVSLLFLFVQHLSAQKVRKSKSDEVPIVKAVEIKNVDELQNSPPPALAVPEEQREIDQTPEYPEGNHEFRLKIGNAFDTRKITDASGTVESQAVFTIDENGSLMNIKTSGPSSEMNEELKNAIIKANGDTKWIPAKREGKNIPFEMRLPITMVFN